MRAMENVAAVKSNSVIPSMPSDQAWQGVSLLLDQYIGLTGEDRALLLYARDAREPAAWVAAEMKAREVTPALIDLNTISGSVSRDFADRLDNASLSPGRIAHRLVVLVVERDMVTPSAWIRTALEPFSGGNVDMFRILMAGEEFFEQGVSVPPVTLNSINAGLLNKLRSAGKFRVRTSSGTDLDITLDAGRYRWVSNRGIPREGAFVFLPAGEVATYPAHIAGTLIADGAFNTTAYTRLDARLTSQPAVIEIEDGAAVGYRCESKSVQKLMDRCFSLPNAKRVGELGFGTNIGIKHFVSLNSHLNERYPGLHIGFGQSNQGRQLYDCSVHLDFIASDCTIEIDGEPPLSSGEFKDLTGQHPAIEVGVFDEDLDGDCCGLFAVPAASECR